MEKSIITTGKTIDDAVEAALAQLGLTRDDVSYQVISLPKSGFFGIGAVPAKVQVTYEAPDLKPARADAAPRTEEKKPEVKPEEKKESAPRIALSSASRSKPKAPKAPAAERTYTPAAAGSNEEKIEVFIKGLLENMGSPAVPHAWQSEEGTYRVDLTGEGLGFLIGRRGETLDAIQHLANYAVNRNVEGHIRINVDAEAYRQKREDSLRRYARKKAQQVLKARRRTTLEPMNAYERHVIHASLQDMDNITTHSTGTEPNRRVVIEYVR